MESIYNFINGNIQGNGKLKNNFNLSKYRKNTDILGYEDGAEDGIILFHAIKEKNSKLIKFIIKQLKTVNEKNILEKMNIIDEYFNKNTSTIICELDEINDWILNNYENTDFDSCMHLAIYLMTESKNINSVKLGIALIGNADISKIKRIKEILIKLALCNEFTLYSILSMIELDERNDIIFMLIKKVDGWGKIHLVQKIDINNEIIRDWLVINGCKNNVKLSYTAIPLAKKMNLLDVLCKKDLSYEEYSGIGDIICGLCDEEITLDTLKSVEFEEIVENYIKRFNEYKSNIENYSVLIKIMATIFRIVYDNDVTEKESRILDDVMGIIESEDSLELYRESINSNEKFKYVLDILTFDFDINLYSEVFEKFKQNPFEYCFCLEYLLKNDIFKSRTIKKLEDSIDLEKYYEEPQSIVGMNSEYCMNLIDILKALEEYPFLSNKFIVAGLKSKYMWARYSAIKTIECWSEKTGKTVNEFPKVIYDELAKLQTTEVIKDYRILINSILKVSEDLSAYEEPAIIMNENDEQEINMGLFDEELDELFESRIRERGEDYYAKKMVYSCNEISDKYVAFVQGSQFGKEYEVNIEKCLNGNIKKMTCTCPYQDYCKHEYATILYLRNKR